MDQLQGYRPRRYSSGPWNPVRKASCEAIHRAVATRGIDPTGAGLRPDTPELRNRIQDVVSLTSSWSLNRILIEEITDYGYITGGWANRWPDPRDRPAIMPPRVPEQTKAQLLEAAGQLILALSKPPGEHGGKKG